MAAQKAGKRAQSDQIVPAAKRGKRAQKADAAHWQRQLLLPNDEPSAPLRAAATSARKRSTRAARADKDDDARAERAAEAALALELAVSAIDAEGSEAEQAPSRGESTAAAADGWQTPAVGRDHDATDEVGAPAANGGETFSRAPDDHVCDPAEVVATSNDAAASMQAIERALLALEQRGGRAYDAISCECARALLQRSAQAAPRAAELLIARAAVHVQRLSDRFDRARASLETRIADAEQQFGALPDERAACARGELVNARRSLRRRACLPAALTRAPAPARFEDYQSASNEWVAVSALARAVDVVPEQAGPYNPLRIASDLLERIRAVSPTYLNAQLTRLEQLASMLALPELPEPAPKPAPRKR